MMKINNSGFTLIEVVMVIAILGVLSAIAAPKFADITFEAEYAAMDAAAGAIKTGISIYFSSNMFSNFPEELDSITPNTSAGVNSPLFSEVIQRGIVTDSWRKVSNDLYTNTIEGVVYEWGYDNQEGTFELVNVIGTEGFPGAGGGGTAGTFTGGGQTGNVFPGSGNGQGNGNKGQGNGNGGGNGTGNQGIGKK